MPIQYAPNPKEDALSQAEMPAYPQIKSRPSARMAKARNFPNRFRAEIGEVQPGILRRQHIEEGSTNRSTKPTTQKRVPSFRSAIRLWCQWFSHSLLLYPYPSALRPFTANSPEGRRCRKRITSTRMNTLPYTAPKTGSISLFNPPMPSEAMMVPASFPTPPVTTTIKESTM